MSQAFTVEAEPREDFGKNVARRTRRSGRIPGIVYGGGGPVIPVTVDPDGIREILHSESGHNAIFTLQVRGKAPARAMIRDWQSEPIRGGLLHVDLVRIALDTKLKLKVAIHVTGEPQGVKVDGGIFEFILREVEVECLPDDIPEAITVDVSPFDDRPKPARVGAAHWPQSQSSHRYESDRCPRGNPEGGRGEAGGSGGRGGTCRA